VRLAWLLLPVMVGGCASLAAQPDLRTITLRLVPDETYQTRDGWEAALRTAVTTVSDIYAQHFQIRLAIHDIVPWSAGETVPAREMLKRLKARMGLGEANVVIAFSHGRCLPPEHGAALPFDQFAFILTGCPAAGGSRSPPTAVILSHEVAHLFGAFHPAPGVQSVMRGGAADRFDDQTIRVIHLMRGFDFRQGVLGMNEPTRRAWSAIYAEGHASGEANPLAAKTAIAGWEAFLAGKRVDGEQAIRTAVELAPADAIARAHLGFLYAAQDRLEAAVQELRSATALDLRLVEPRSVLGFVLLRLGKDDEAYSEFREARRMDPRFAPARVGIATIFARRERLADAIREMYEAARLDPRNGDTQLRLARLLYQGGYHAEALQAARRARSLGRAVPADFLRSLEPSAPTR
jgi:Tfp pilus assembly protein PilF